MSNAIIINPLMPVAASAPSGTAAGSASHAAIDPAADFMGMFWQSSGTTAQMQVDMGADVSIDTFALLCVSGFPPGATWSILYATDAQGASFSSIGTGVGQYQFVIAGTLVAGDSPLASGRQASLWTGNVSSPITARYFRFNVPGVTSGQFRVSRVILGRRIALTRNFVFGGAFAVKPFGKITYSSRAVLLRRRAPNLRAVGLSFPNIYRDEIESQIQPLLETVSNDRPLLLVTDPDAHSMRTRRMYFGHLDGDIGTIWRTAAGWEWRANMVSLF